MRTVRIDPSKPVWFHTVDDFIEYAIAQALSVNGQAVGLFNESAIVARPGMTAAEILKNWRWHMKHQGRKYSKLRGAQRRRDRRERVRRSKAATLAKARWEGREIAFKDESAWNKGREINKDPYGNGVYEFAKYWALGMEDEIAKGATLVDCADSTQRIADDIAGGITGFMYGAAVSVLSACWAHGEELRVWHNGKYGHGGGGVVNPAILTIGAKEAPNA